MFFAEEINENPLFKAKFIFRPGQNVVTYSKPKSFVLTLDQLLPPKKTIGMVDKLNEAWYH